MHLLALLLHLGDAEGMNPAATAGRLSAALAEGDSAGLCASVRKAAGEYGMSALAEQVDVRGLWRRG